MIDRSRIALAILSIMLAAGSSLAHAQQASDQPTPVGEAPKPAAPAAPAQIFAEPTALTPGGTFVIEPDVQYVHSTNNQVSLVGYTVLPALTIGLINVQRIESDLSTFSLTARYGIVPRVELEVRVPYVVEDTSTETRPLATAAVANSFFSAYGNGFGDAQATLRIQLNHLRADNAVWIGSLTFKSRTGSNIFQEPIDPSTDLQTRLPTGSGFYAVQPGITFLKPSDPAVFFGGLAYTKSFARDVGFGYGYIDPGAIFDLTIGMGLALNERASFSMGYQHSVVLQTTQPTPGTGLAISRVGTLELGTLRFGVTYRLTSNTYFNFTLGIGVTRDTPDLEATTRLPTAL
jgi:hypothetical protein